jgi:serine phosphatase RsbU (regulator of sigma subunit)
MNNPEIQRNTRKDTQALLGMARALGATCDLGTLLKMVVDYSMDLLDAERATLFLYDKQREELYSRIAEGTGEFRISINTGIAGAAARNLEIINVPDAYQDPRFNRQVDQQTGYRTRSILAFPLTDYDGRLVGVLQVLNKRKGPFDEGDIELATALSAQAGVALQRAYLLQEFLEKQRLEQSLQIAKEIQEKLLPSQAPQLSGFDIACWNRPCDAIGGDFCDFVPLDENRLAVTFGDVSGHGVGPALISCATRAMLRAFISGDDSIDSIMQRVNQLITSDMPDNRFITAFTGLMDNNTGHLTYCSAGQGPLLWLHAQSNTVETLGADGIPVGILDDMPPLPVKTIPLQKNDAFVLLTDGFYEWAQKKGELFGIERVIEIIQVNKNDSAENILSAVRKAVESFADTSQADDLTAIIIKKL